MCFVLLLLFWGFVCLFVGGGGVVVDDAFCFVLFVCLFVFVLVQPDRYLYFTFVDGALKIGTPVATLPGAWHYKVSAGTGRPGVSVL